MDTGGQSTSPGTGPGVSSLAALIYALSRPSRAKVTERESGESELEPRSAKSRACKVLTTYGICRAWGGRHRWNSGSWSGPGRRWMVTPIQTTGNRAPGLPSGWPTHPQLPSSKGSGRSSLGFEERCLCYKKPPTCFPPGGALPPLLQETRTQLCQKLAV